MAGADDARLVRRLRLALVGVSMLCGLCVLAVAAVLVYWRLYLLGPSSGPFARGPFLTRLNGTSAQLKWTLKDGGRTVELRALAPDGRPAEAVDGRFSGLKPGTRYAWTASVDGIGRAAGSFQTAPPNLRRPIRFVAFGDYGSGNDHEYAVGRIAAAQAPAFALTAGDNSYLAATAPLLDRNIFKPLQPLMANAPLWASLGEHDLFLTGGRDVVQALDSPGDGHLYSVRYGPIQVIVLGLTAVDAKARAFARRALREGHPAVRFLLVHRPLQPGNPLLADLRRAHVAAIIAGHLHRYERRVVGGVLQLTVGTGGEGPGDEQFTKASADAKVSLEDYGFLRVDVRNAGIRYRFVDERGRVLDRWDAAR
jgi:hypothetical protein